MILKAYWVTKDQVQRMLNRHGDKIKFITHCISYNSPQEPDTYMFVIDETP